MDYRINSAADYFKEFFAQLPPEIFPEWMIMEEMLDQIKRNEGEDAITWFTHKVFGESGTCPEFVGHVNVHKFLKSFQEHLKKNEAFEFRKFLDDYPESYFKKEDIKKKNK